MRKRERIPVVTLVILGLNIYGLIYEYQHGEMAAMYAYGMYQGALRNGEYVRIFTNAFLHWGIYHFLCNMVCLVSYGFSLENRIGPARYAAIYMAAIAGAGLLIDQAGGTAALHAGASGAVWGLMTATLVYNLRNNISAMYAVRGITLNLIYSFSAGVSWQAHIGGGISGLILALIICKADGSRQNINSGSGNDDGNGIIVRF